MEIVSQARYARRRTRRRRIFTKLRAIVRYLELATATWTKGSMRCDVNVSVRKPGASELGTRCEIKNVNSVSFVAAGDRI